MNVGICEMKVLRYCLFIVGVVMTCGFGCGCTCSNYGSKIRELGCVYVGGTIDSFSEDKIWISEDGYGARKYFAKIPAKRYRYFPVWGEKWIPGHNDNDVYEGYELNRTRVDEMEFKELVPGKYIWVKLDEDYGKYLIGENFDGKIALYDTWVYNSYVASEDVPKRCRGVPIIKSRMIYPKDGNGVPVKGFLETHTAGYPFYFVASLFVSVFVDVPITFVYNIPTVCAWGVVAVIGRP